MPCPGAAAPRGTVAAKAGEGGSGKRIPHTPQKRASASVGVEHRGQAEGNMRALELTSSPAPCAGWAPFPSPPRRDGRWGAGWLAARAPVLLGLARALALAVPPSGRWQARPGRG